MGFSLLITKELWALRTYAFGLVGEPELLAYFSSFRVLMAWSFRNFYGEKCRESPTIGFNFGLIVDTFHLLNTCLLKPASVLAKLFRSLRADRNCVLFISARRPSLSSENPKAFDLSKKVTLWYSSYCGTSTSKS